MGTKKIAIRSLVSAGLMAVLALGFSAGRAAAVPAFAVQTGKACVSCHVGGFGPQLTPYGREFKMGGYTTRAVAFNAPISAMAVASYVGAKASQASPPAADFRTNDNVALDQASVFIAGGLGDHFGGFIQTTYDGVARAFHWDNLDLRAVTTATVKGVPMVLGLSVNNAPTVQDAFNTLPAWGFPYTASSLAPAPGSAPLVGSLAQNTIGLTAYAWINSQFYVEAGGYRSPTPSLLTRIGIDPTDPGAIQGTAPYARLAYLKDFGDRNFQVGAFLMQANLLPGLDNSTGMTDHYRDVGLDASYQLFAANHNVFTLNSRYIYETQNLDASQALGMAAHSNQRLRDARVDASYYFGDVIGVTAGAFNTTGSGDSLLYAANRTLRPDSSGLSLQVDGTPFGTPNSPLGPRFNIRIGAQYISYLRFDGAAKNYDGSGRSAADNNTFRVFLWAAY